jgi:hypothetical protein
MSLLSQDLVGTWELVSRHTQRGADGPVVPRPDTVIGLVVYDAGGNFSAQFMDREREDGSADTQPAPAASGANNSRTIAGYDAYFGRYVVDDNAGTVTQTLRGSLARENVGQVLTRTMQVVGDELTIRVDTTDDDGEDLALTLIWKRVG